MEKWKADTGIFAMRLISVSFPRDKLSLRTDRRDLLIHEYESLAAAADRCDTHKLVVFKRGKKSG